MRFHPTLLLFPLVSLAACQPDPNPGPRVDFVASSRFTTGNRRITTPGDTVATRIYAEAQGSETHLRHMRITVDYVPIPEPYIYPALPDPDNTPKSYLVYLDTTFSTVSSYTDEFAFQNVQTARTTAGKEVWHYDVEDTNGDVGKRSFFLRLGRPDSSYIYHSYRVGLQAPLTTNLARRSYLALRSGLALPKFTVRRPAQLQDNDQVDAQQLIDLVYIPTATTPGLATPSNTVAKLQSWPTKRLTRIRTTGLTAEDFTALTSNAQLTAAFTNNKPKPSTDSTFTGALVKNQVIAFLTPEGKSGAILVEDILTTGVPTLVLQVRVTK